MKFCIDGKAFKTCMKKVPGLKIGTKGKEITPNFFYKDHCLMYQIGKFLAKNKRQ